MSTKTRFEKEAKGNSEMAYPFLVNPVKKSLLWVEYTNNKGV